MLVLLRKFKYKFHSVLYMTIKHRFKCIFIYYEYTIPCYKYVYIFLSSVLSLNAATVDFCAMAFINAKTEVKLKTACEKVTNHGRDFIIYAILCGYDDGV